MTSRIVAWKSLPLGAALIFTPAYAGNSDAGQEGGVDPNIQERLEPYLFRPPADAPGAANKQGKNAESRKSGPQPHERPEDEAQKAPH